MIQEQREILFISAFRTTFIQDDIDFLEKHFHLRILVGHGFMALWKIMTNVFRSDIVVCWFGSVYAFVGIFFGRMVGVKSVVMVGGVDAAKDEKLQYGIWLSSWRTKLVRYAIRHADKILAVDTSLVENLKRLAGYDGKNIACLPTGFDPEFWKPLGLKDDTVLTVAIVPDRTTALVKGIDILIDAAWKMPDKNFIVVGIDPHADLNLFPPLNMKFYPAVGRSELLPFYRQAKIYCQPSRREGLSNALCEAMLCECIPVATAVGGTLTAIGTEGFLIPPAQHDSLVEGLLRAFQTDESVGKRARLRIVSLFPKQKRETDLLHILNSL